MKIFVSVTTLLSVRNKLHAAAIALAFTAVTMIACSERGPQLPVLSEAATILAFGDSLTKGTGAGTESSYPAELARLSGRNVVNAGVPGEVSALGLARLAALLDEVSPELLILCHGGNDMLRKISAKTARANIEAMIDLARERSISVLLLGVPKPGLWLATADFYHEIAVSTNTPIEADALASILGDSRLKSDPVHPNAAGYAHLAARIHEKLQALGAL